MLYTTTEILPPQTLTNFSSNLLGFETGIKSREVYEKHCKAKIYRKYKENSSQRKEYEELLQCIGEIYGWKKDKKAYERSTDREKRQRPFFPIQAVDRIGIALGISFRYLFDKIKTAARDNNEI